MTRFAFKRRLKPFLITISITFLLLATLIIFFKHGSNSISKKAIHIGVVTCISSLPPENLTKPEEPTFLVALIKSVFMSAVLHKVENPIKFHLFLDHPLLQKFVASLMVKLREAFPEVNVNYAFHPLRNSVPDGHFHEFGNVKGCRFVRLFFPYSLAEVEQILYLDTDIVITGNILELWSKFDEMKEKEFVAIAPNDEPNRSTHFNGVWELNFKEIPHVPPKGVNTGVMLMDLKKMRKFEWIKQVYSTYQEFHNKSKRIVLSDQKIVNIILRRNPDSYKLLTCQFNFQHLHCDVELTCKHAEEDPLGIQVVHGAGHHFSETASIASSMHQIFRMYADYDCGKKDSKNFVKELILPLKQYYTVVSSYRTCFRRLKSVLFKGIEF